MEKRKQKAEYRMFAGTRGDASTALLVFAVFFLFLLGEYHSLRAQEKSAFITQYNERFKAKDYVHAREALDILLASEPKDLQLKREKIKLFGALREETNFLEGMKNLRNQGDMAAVQNFFDIIDCDDVPETFKEKLKAYFQEKKDSFLLANWEKEERKKGWTITISPSLATSTADSASPGTTPSPDSKQPQGEAASNEPKKEEKPHYIPPEKDPGFTRHSYDDPKKRDQEIKDSVNRTGK